VEDGRVWTSAGVTTGIDMCLALVARDLGDTGGERDRTAPGAVCAAARLPVAVQPVLAAQAADSAFSGLIDWIREHLDEIWTSSAWPNAPACRRAPSTAASRMRPARDAGPRASRRHRLDHARQLRAGADGAVPRDAWRRAGVKFGSEHFLALTSSEEL
jgi:hypothetical protein